MAVTGPWQPRWRMPPLRRTCSSCGQTCSARPSACANAWCSEPEGALGAVFAVGGYRGRLRRAIVSYKYAGDLRWAGPFARMLCGLLGAHPTWFEEFSVLSPVPAFAGPGAPRRWDHMGLVCEEMSHLTGACWPIERLVSKRVPTPAMSGLSRAQRCRAAQGRLQASFVVPRPEAVQGSCVVLVDDVCASGSTLVAAAGALRAAGAAEVVGLVLARAVWRRDPRPAGAGPEGRGRDQARRVSDAWTIGWSS